MVFNVFNYYTCSFPELNTLGQIGNFSSRIGKKTYFLALGMGPNFGPKFRRSRALRKMDVIQCSKLKFEILSDIIKALQALHDAPPLR